MQAAKLQLTDPPQLPCPTWNSAITTTSTITTTNNDNSRQELPHASIFVSFSCTKFNSFGATPTLPPTHTLASRLRSVRNLSHGDPQPFQPHLIHSIHTSSLSLRLFGHQLSSLLLLLATTSFNTRTLISPRVRDLHLVTAF